MNPKQILAVPGRMRLIFCLCILGTLVSSQAFGVTPVSTRLDTLDIYGGPGVLEGKFEDDQGDPDPQGWAPMDYSDSGTGNFGQLWVGLDDVDPDQDNLSPQWAFLDDGIVVPGAGPSHCLDDQYCYGPDGLVTNGTGGLLGGSNLLYSCILSQPIALPTESGWPVLSLDAYLHNGAFGDGVFMTYGLEATDDPEGINGWDFYSDGFFHANYEGSYLRKTTEFDSDLMPEGKRWVRIRMGAHQAINMGFPSPGTPAPYLDNVRLQWISEAVASAPIPDNLLMAEAYPNPFNPTVSVKWSARAGSTATVKIHDLKGKHVATLYDGVMAADLGEATWHGVYDNGEPAAAGIYLCRVLAGDKSQMIKLSLVK